MAGAGSSSDGFSGAEAAWLGAPERRPLGALLDQAGIWLPALLLVGLGWRHRWTMDDAFIDFHVADNLLGGWGPVFNISERVEVYTSPIWLALVTGLGGVSRWFVHGRAPFEWIAAILGLLTSGLALAFAGLGSRALRRSRGQSDPLIPLGTLVVLALTPFWDFATSGLEGGLVWFWLASSFFGLTRSLSPATTQRVPYLRALWFGLGTLVRPDLLLFSLMFLGLLVAFTPGRRARIACTAAALALPVSLEIFRMGYFGALVPNPAFTKEAALAYWPRGKIYLWDLLQPYRLWLPLGVIALAELALLFRFWRSGAERAALVVAALLAGGVLHGLYITRVGGDFLHGRLLLPSVLAVALPLATVPWSLFLRTGPIVLPWAVACALWFRIPYGEKDGLCGIERGRLNYLGAAGGPHPVTLEDYKKYLWVSDAHRMQSFGGGITGTPGYRNKRPIFSSSIDAHVKRVNLASWVEADVVAFRSALGMFAFGAGQRVHACDQMGLVDPVGSRLMLVGRGKSGHEKVSDIGWCTGRVLAPEEDTPNERDARQALRCGPLPELQAAVTAPLTWSRFWRNVWVAPRLTLLRIPAEPADARKAFCGPSWVDPIPGKPDLLPEGVLSASSWVKTGG